MQRLSVGLVNERHRPRRRQVQLQLRQNPVTHAQTVHSSHHDPLTSVGPTLLVATDVHYGV